MGALQPSPVTIDHDPSSCVIIMHMHVRDVANLMPTAFVKDGRSRLM